MSALQQEIRDVIEPLVAEIASLKTLISDHVGANVEVKLITVRDAAKRLGCGEETVRRMVNWLIFVCPTFRANASTGSFLDSRVIASWRVS